MLRNILELNPFFQTDDSNAGKSAEELAAEQEAASKIAAENDEYAKMQATLEANRDAILSLDKEDSDSSKIEKENEANKTPEQIATEAANKIADEVTSISEEFISDYSKAGDYFGFEKLDQTKVKEALNSLKGRKLDNHTLKSYVHTQVKLQEYKEKEKADPDKIKSVEDHFAADENNNQETVKPKYSDRDIDTKGLNAEEIESISTAKSNALYNMLKPKYKDLTPDDVADEDAINDFIATININKPLLADDFKADFRRANGTITREINEFKDRAQNWRVHLKEDAAAEIEKFGKYVTGKGIPIEKLEANLKDENFIINTILKDSTGKIKKEIVKNYKDSADIFVLDRDKFYSEMVNYFDPKITDLTKKIGATDFMTKKVMKEAGPSLSNSATQGEAMKREDFLSKGIIPDDSTFDYEQMEKVLEKNRQDIRKANAEPFV